ncbi:MAG: citrate:proton symporter [Bryobacteraceae bacterium]|jgi:citrate-Mg2+:H+ or citrate-Ca2+:H+ symporter, CitMHS family
MLALLGVVTIVTLLVVILTKAMTPLSALIAVPVAAALAGGFGAKTAGFMLHGIQGVAGVAGMFIFAILFFGIMTDAGMLDPIIDGILRAVGSNPARIVMGTSLLALLVHLDGSGAVTFLVTVPVMLPLYDRLGMDKRVLACAASMAAGVNFLPWTGPMIRASASLHLPVASIFNPLIPVQAAGLVFVFAAAWWLGKREARRLSRSAEARASAARHVREIDEAGRALRRPRRFWINLLLTGSIIAGMTALKLEPVAVFMVGVVLALQINYPNLKIQRERINAHAQAALMMAGILFAAGAFTGIMKDSGMLDAMAKSAIGLTPSNAGRHLPFALGLVSMPLSVLFDPDSFYFGVLPVLSQAAAKFGVPPVQMAQSAMLGLHTTGFPVSPLTPAPFLLVGLAGIEFREHQRFSWPFLLAASVWMTLVCVAIGIFPI